MFVYFIPFRYKEVPSYVDNQHVYPILWSTQSWVPV